ncbi:MAG: ribosome recycling factor [Phycisphaerae bacterium]|jgi:ribosome recycling factor|nr:ribosome recycling factor [Phycisphaerae bacterium]
MSIKAVTKDCQSKMDKSVEYFGKELHGIRTGRANTALIEYIKIEYYGSPTDLKDISAISVSEVTQLVVKPYDPSSKNDIIKGLESANLGLNPQSEGDIIRINIPAPSAERRAQLVNQVKKMSEESRIAIRNERRDAIKHIDVLVKDKSNAVSEDDGKHGKDDVESMTKKHISKIDEMTTEKSKEVETI